MIELMAEKLKITVSEAIAVLVANGTIDDSASNYGKKVQDYLIRTIGLRAKILEFWEKCKENSKNMLPDHRVIAAKMGLKVGHNWESLGSTLVGFCNRLDVEKTFTMSNNGNDQVNLGSHRTLTGEGWDEVCVIPAFDMPGRIKTLVLIGNLASPELRVVCRHVSYKLWGPHDNECGTLFLEEALRSKHDNIVVSGDMIDTVRLTLDYVDRHNNFPPIVAIPEDEARLSDAWRVLSSENKIITVVGAKAEALSASSSSIRVSQNPGSWEAGWMGPSKWIAKVHAAGVVKKKVETSPLEVGWSKITHNGVSYEERPDGIYCKERLMCDAVLKIDKIAIEGTKNFYIGRVKCGGVEAPFKVNMTAIDQAFSKWLKAFCIKNDMQLPVCNNGYARVAAKIALLSKPPDREVLTPMEAEKQDIEYNFYKFEISSKGEVIDITTYRKLNGTECFINEPMTVFEKGALSDEKSALVWAVIIPCMANAIASKIGLATVGIGVDPESFEDIKFIGNKLGCYTNKLTGPVFTKSVISTTLSDETKSHLPMVIAPDKPDAPIQRLGIEKASGARNCIIPMDYMALLGCRTVSRWVYLRPSAVEITRDTESALNKLSLSFLSWMAKRGYKTAGFDLIHKTVNALEDWCNANKISTEGLVLGATMIDSDLSNSLNKSITNSFTALCGKFSNMGYFEKSCKRQSKRIVKFGESIWVECRELFNACKAHNIPLLEPSRLAQALLATKTILDYTNNPDTRIPCWVIDPINWNEWPTKL